MPSPQSSQLLHGILPPLQSLYWKLCLGHHHGQYLWVLTAAIDDWCWGGTWMPVVLCTAWQNRPCRTCWVKPRDCLSTEWGLSWARGDLGSHTEATWAFCIWLLPYRLLSATCCSWRAPSSQVRQLGSQGSLTLTEEEGDRTFRGGTGEGVSVKNRREGTEQHVEKWGENSVCWLLFGASFPGNRRKAGA